MDHKPHGRTTSPNPLNPPTASLSPIPYGGNESLVLRCLRNQAPSSHVLRYGRAPLKVLDDDVLVMDGVLLTGGDASSSSSASSTSLFHGASRKNELCRSWESMNHCIYASNCQFAHGKEDLRPSYVSFKRKIEARKPQPYAGTYPSSLTGLGHRLPHMLMSEARRACSKLPIQRSESSHEITAKSHCLDNKASSAITNGISLPDSTKSVLQIDASERECKKIATYLPFADWCPLDDGIDIKVPEQVGQSSGREAVLAYMDTVFSGSSNKRRLPVFSELTETNDA